jgi:hypothetical protein
MLMKTLLLTTVRYRVLGRALGGLVCGRVLVVSRTRQAADTASFISVHVERDSVVTRALVPLYEDCMRCS